MALFRLINTGLLLQYRPVRAKYFQQGKQFSDLLCFQLVTHFMQITLKNIFQRKILKSNVC